MILSLKKEDRLRSSKDFLDVFHFSHDKKSIFRSPPYVIYRGEPSQKPRLGITISKRFVKKAHERNRIKRSIKEFFRLHKRDIQSHSWVVKVAFSTHSFDFETLTTPLSCLLSKKNVSSKVTY